MPKTATHKAQAVVTRVVTVEFEDNGITDLKDQAHDLIRDHAGITIFNENEYEVTMGKVFELTET